ncbi:MAG: formate--tetrahydrofolate ligase [Clostridia bacterium]
MTDIEIANSVELKKIGEIAKKLSITEDEYDCYGKYKAKINVAPNKMRGKLILVTAINPTPLGEGKTTVSIGLADAISAIGKKVCLALREPSLGPVFGIKGGAAGGGRSQVAPMSEINLHFTGDIHAITAANNLICSIIDNHITQGNELKIDTTKITFKRCMDLNDRALRSIVCGLGSGNGVPREDGFTITAASEVMAVLCLSENLMDFKRRIGEIVVAYDSNNQPILARQLDIQNAVTILMTEAIKPNLVQTLEATPCIIHGGPFANIAHGCNSIIATKTALSLADYVVTEAGFGADLGAEKFIDIKCRQAGIEPSAIVLVTTVRALKYNGGVAKQNLIGENFEALKIGLPNLLGHIENLTKVFGANVIVAINKFVTDTNAEIDFIKNECNKLGAEVEVSEAWEFGSKGAINLAKKVVDTVDNCKTHIKFAYDIEDSIVDKITAICTKIYGAGKVEFTAKALSSIKNIENAKLDKYPICIAKTQYSFTDDQTMLARPKGFVFHINDVVLRNGAGFIVGIAGNIMLMPGLAKVPSACKMEIDENLVIKGLF